MSGSVKVALAAVVLGFVVFGIVACLPVAGAFYCPPPPSEQQLQEQRVFVSSHLGDARDFESGTADCDDDNGGYVYFDTPTAPAAAREAFLVDGRCSSYSDQGQDDIAVKCASSGFTVYVFFEPSPDGTIGSSGELYMDT